MFLAVSAVFIFCALSCGPAESEPTQLDFTLQTLDGGQLTLAGYKGKEHILLTFWTTWCPACKVEMSELKKRYAELKANGFEILAVNIQEDAQVVKSFATSRGLEFPILLDRDASVAKNYGVVSIPTLFIIDKEGNLRHRGHAIPRNYLNLVK
jgi:peroxiredoxin